MNNGTSNIRYGHASISYTTDGTRQFRISKYHLFYTT